MCFFLWVTLHLIHVYFCMCIQYGTISFITIWYLHDGFWVAFNKLTLGVKSGGTSVTLNTYIYVLGCHHSGGKLKKSLSTDSLFGLFLTNLFFGLGSNNPMIVQNSVNLRKVVTLSKKKRKELPSLQEKYLNSWV